MSLLSEIQNAPAALSQKLLFCFHFSLVWENRNAATIWAILVILVSCIPIYGATCKIHSILCIVFSGCERSCKLTSLDLRVIELSYENETMPHHWALFSVASKSSVDIVSIWWLLHTNPFLCWSLLKGGEIVRDQFLLFTTCHYSLAGCGAFPRPHCLHSTPASVFLCSVLLVVARYLLFFVFPCCCTLLVYMCGSWYFVLSLFVLLLCCVTFLPPGGSRGGAVWLISATPQFLLWDTFKALQCVLHHTGHNCSPWTKFSFHILSIAFIVGAITYIGPTPGPWTNR